MYLFYRRLIVIVITLLLSNFAVAEAVKRFIAEQYQKNQQYKEKIATLEEKLAQLQNQFKQQQQDYQDFKKIILLLNAQSSPTIKKITNKNFDNHLYRQARQLLLAQQYEKAIRVLLDYIKQYPDAENTAEAIFWLANSYIANGQFDNGAKKYLIFTTKYPNHYKIPEALYRLGITQHELGYSHKSILLFESILRRFPRHAIISQVKESLSRLQTQAKNSTKTL